MFVFDSPPKLPTLLMDVEDQEKEWRKYDKKFRDYKKRSKKMAITNAVIVCLSFLFVSSVMVAFLIRAAF